MSVKQKPLKIKVTFPNGKIICYAIVEKTLIETLKEIGSHRFNKIHLEKGHLPLISKVKHMKYGNWMKPVVDGWYINTQSDTNEKYMQLIAIKKQLNLDIKVEIGRDFETQSSKTGKTRTKSNDTLRVIIGNEIDVTTEPYFVYFGVLQKIGFEAIRKKNISIQDQKLVTLTNQYGSIQVQTNDSLWITMPPRESMVIKWLSIVTSIMGFKITLIDVIHNRKFVFPKNDITTTVKPTNETIRPRLRSKPLQDNPLPITPNLEIEQQEKKAARTFSRKKLELNYNGTVFHVNDIVIHKIWGKGIIKEMTLDGSLLGVKFHDTNVTYVKPNTLELTDNNGTKKSKEKDFDRIIPAKDRKYSSEKLAANAKIIRKLMRTGGISLGGMIYSSKYGSGIIIHIDSFCIKASFNNVVEVLYIGKDYIQI